MDETIKVIRGDMLFGAPALVLPGGSRGLPQTTRVDLRAILNYLVRAAAVAEPAGPLNGAVLKLFATASPVTDESVAGDFTLPTFTGYATSSAITWGLAYTEGDGTCSLVGSPKTFTRSGGAISNTIFGVLLETAAGVLIAAERFDQPVLIDEIGKAVTVIPHIGILNANALGGAGTIYTRIKLRECLTYLVRAAAVAEPAGPLHGLLLDLFANAALTTDESVLADYTIATFDGYAQSTAAVWSAAFTNPDGSAEIVGDVKTFAQSGVVVTQPVYGYLVTDAGGLLQTSELFPAPLAMDEVGKAVSLVPRARLANVQ